MERRLSGGATIVLPVPRVHEVAVCLAVDHGNGRLRGDPLQKNLLLSIRPTWKRLQDEVMPSTGIIAWASKHIGEALNL